MIRTPCKHCARNSPAAFLCDTCQDELRDMLTHLARGRKRKHGGHEAGWLDHLCEAALGQTKLGEAARRSPRYRNTIDGEKSLASQIEILPGEQWETVEGPALDGERWPLKIPSDTEVDLETARRAREHAVLQRALGMGRVNLRAAELLEYTHSVIVEWVRDLCETRKVEVPQGETNDLLLWLARNVSAVAADEGAAVCYREIKQIVEDIERCINRPESHHQYCGTCSALLDSEVCQTELHAKRGEKHVQCRRCKAVYDVDELIEKGLESVDEWMMSEQEVLDTMAAIGEPVPYSTWTLWRREKRLVVRGWRDGRPQYWIGDVRELRAAKPQKVATGAAARRQSA